MSASLPAISVLPDTYGLTVDKSGPIRRFTQSGIQEAVDQAIGNLKKEGKSIAVVAVANRNEAGVAVMYRIGDDWSIVTVAEKSWNGDGFKLQAAVKWSK